jgi:hypothetical protein
MQSVSSADDDYEVTPHPQEGSIHVRNNKNDPKITVEIMLTSPVVREPLAESAGAGKYKFLVILVRYNTVKLILSI